MNVDKRNVQHIQKMVAAEFAVLTLGAFFYTTCHGVNVQHRACCFQQMCDRRDMLIPLGSQTRKLLWDHCFFISSAVLMWIRYMVFLS